MEIFWDENICTCKCQNFAYNFNIIEKRKNIYTILETNSIFFSH